MTGYLIILRHMMDDFPMGLFVGRQAAIDFADHLDWYPTDEMIQRVGFPDSGTPLSICMVRFISGKPVRIELLREWEAEHVDEKS